MEIMGKPSKEEVRVWMQQRRSEKTPPPNIEQIRRELGWKLTMSQAGDMLAPLLIVQG